MLDWRHGSGGGDVKVVAVQEKQFADAGIHCNARHCRRAVLTSLCVAKIRSVLRAESFFCILVVQLHPRVVSTDLRPAALRHVVHCAAE